MGKLLAGIDLGTTALKIAVFDTTGKMQGNATLEYQLITPKPYFVESDPAVYMDAIVKGFGKLAEQGVDLMDLAAISFSLQSETMFFVDEYGVPLRNSISWMAVSYTHLDVYKRQEAASALKVLPGWRSHHSRSHTHWRE